MNPSHHPLTRELAAYGVQSRFSALPPQVRAEAARAFMNWVGCVLGGCREPTVELAAATVAELGGGPQSSIFGSRQRSDMASASFVNCIASSVQAFDDAHLSTVIHPSGPAGASVFAFSETRRVSGEDFLNAFALAIEIQCRLATALVLPPSRFNGGFYVTGLVGPIGIAMALGNLLGLDEQRMNWAIGLGASQGGGFRATHGTMTAHFRPGHTTRCGVWAALLAQKGFTSDDYALEAEKGFFDVYSEGADLARVTAGIGEKFELLNNGYKPYPCGIVIHAALDACLDVRRQAAPGARVVKAVLRTHPLALSMCGVRTPATPLESHVSVYHWAAAALVRGRAGLAEMRPDCIADPDVVALRSGMEVISDPSVGREQAVAEVTFSDGRTLRSHVLQVSGSGDKPMTDEALDAKFRSQALEVLPEDRVEQLLAACRNVAALDDVGREIGALIQSG